MCGVPGDRRGARPRPPGYGSDMAKSRRRRITSFPFIRAGTAFYGAEGAFGTARGRCDALCAAEKARGAETRVGSGRLFPVPERTRAEEAAP